MAHKKKYHGGLLAFFSLLLVFLLGNISCVFASVSREYFDYMIDNMADNTTYSWLGNRLSNLNETQKTDIFTQLNNKLITEYIDFLNDKNCALFVNYSSTSSATIMFVFSHMGYSQDSENMGYMRIFEGRYNTNYVSYGDTDDVIYNISFHFDNNSYSLSEFATYTSSSGGGGPAMSGYSVNNENTILTIPNVSAYSGQVVYMNYPLTSSNTTIYYPYFLNGTDGNYQPPIEPDEPVFPSGDSGLGNITTPSGDNGGTINLQPIQQGITDIQNQISGDSQRIIDNQIENTQTIVNALSGETEKITNTLTESADDEIDNTVITSGDITSSLGFTLATDRYANFWLEFTNGLKNALLGENRTITITFQNNTFTINLNDFAILPSWLRIFLVPLSTSLFVWILVKWWKIIINNITSGDVDTLLKDNKNEGITNLF